MPVENLRISDISIHEVFNRDQNGTVNPPRLAEREFTASAEARTHLSVRILAALGVDSDGIPVDIDRRDERSGYGIALSLRACTREHFVSLSGNFAARLHETQVTRKIHRGGGIVLVFRGTADVNNHPVVGVIKAQKHGGLRQDDARNIIYDDTLFLTPDTKLYKVGLFSFGANPDLPDQCDASIYDHLVTGGRTSQAANYFYEAFLGCRLPENAARDSRKWYLEASTYIQSSPDLPFDETLRAQRALDVYIESDTSPTISTPEFARRYLPEPVQDTFVDFMNRKEISPAPIFKSTLELQKELKQARLSFYNGVVVDYPPAEFGDTVIISDATPENAPADEVWTNILVKARRKEVS